MELKTRHFVIMAITLITAVAMYQNIALTELQNVYIVLAGTIALDKVNAMFEERRLKKKAI